MPDNKPQPREVQKPFVAEVLLAGFYKEMEDSFKKAMKSQKDIIKTLLEIIAKFTLLEIHIKITRIVMLIIIGFCLYFLMSNLFLLYILSMEGNSLFVLYSCLSLCFVISMNYFKAVFKSLLPFLEEIEKKRQFYIGLLLKLKTIEENLTKYRKSAFI